jgi:hypothetical protein
MKELPRFSELPLVGTTKERHAWGVFGEADEIGTVNLLEAAQVKQASKLVRTGKTMNLSIPLNYPITLYDMPTRSGYKHHIEVSRAGRDDYIDNFAMQVRLSGIRCDISAFASLATTAGVRTRTSMRSTNWELSIGRAM